MARKSGTTKRQGVNLEVRATLTQEINQIRDLEQFSVISTYLLIKEILFKLNIFDVTNHLKCKRRGNNVRQNIMCIIIVALEALFSSQHENMTMIGKTRKNL